MSPERERVGGCTLDDFVPSEKFSRILKKKMEVVLIGTPGLTGVKNIFFKALAHKSCHGLKRVIFVGKFCRCLFELKSR